MTAAVSLVLPYPPSVNRYWTVLRNGQVVQSSEAKSYKDDVAKMLAGRTPLWGPVFIARFHIHPPRASCDLDGVLKCVFDALNLHAWLDDNQVYGMDNLRRFDATHARHKSCIELDVQAERFCSPDEVREFALAKAATDLKKKIGRAKAKQTSLLERAQTHAMQPRQQPNETQVQYFNRIATPAYRPGRK